MQYNVRQYSVSEHGKHFVCDTWTKTAEKVVKLSRFTQWVEVYKVDKNGMTIIKAFSVQA
jgi:hypothetical protein